MIVRDMPEEVCTLDKDNTEYTHDIAFSGTTAATGLQAGERKRTHEWSDWGGEDYPVSPMNSQNDPSPYFYSFISW